MKAVIYTNYGPPEVLRLTEVPNPTPKDNEVLIKIEATTVTSGDWRARSMDIPSKALWLPARLILGLTKPKNQILGTELSGRIAAIGKNVSKFKVGDPVFAATGANGGAHAEYVCLPENGALAPKPSNTTYQEAAAIPFGGLTALYYLRDLGRLKAGQEVLIYGASGGVGTYAVQIAKALGAHVTGVCSGKNVELVKSLGADRTVDYTQQDFRSLGHKYDIVFDTVGKTSFASCKSVLKRGGKYLAAVLALTEILQMLQTSVMGDKKVLGGVMSESAADLLILKDWAEAGKLKVVIDRKYSLEEMVAAHRYVDTGHKVGNVSVEMATS